MKSSLFDLSGRVAVITGGAGLLGGQHGRVVAEAGGTPVLLEMNGEGGKSLAAALATEFGVPARAVQTNIVDRQEVQQALATALDMFGRIDILINNATNNPKVAHSGEIGFSRFENFSLEQ